MPNPVSVNLSTSFVPWPIARATPAHLAGASRSDSDPGVGADRSRMPWRRTTIGLVAAFVAVRLLILADVDAGFTVGLVIAFVAVLALHIVVHELGHAFVGALMGFRVDRVVSGSGPRLLHLRTQDTEVEFRLFPTGGATRFSVFDALAPGPHLVRRFALTVAAGPAAALLLGFVLAEPLLGNWTDTMRMANGSTRTFDAADMARTLGFWLLVLNLLPFRGRDGAHLMSILRSGPHDRLATEQRLASAAFTNQVMDYETDLVLRECAVHPELLENPYTRTTHAVALLFEERPHEAIRSLEPIVDHDLPDDLRKMVPYTLAVACLEADPVGLCVETDEWIERTVWSRGARDPLTFVARALQAARLGDSAAALEWVEAGLAERPPPGFDPKDLSFLHQARAEAHRRAGDFDAASSSIRAALRLRPGHPMIERERVRVERAIERDRESSS